MRSVILADNARFEIRDIDEAPIAADTCRIGIDAAGICSSDVPRGFDNGAYFYPLVMGHWSSPTELVHRYS